MNYKQWINKIEKCGENIDHELISKLSFKEIEKLANGFKYFGINTQESIDNLLLIAQNYRSIKRCDKCKKALYHGKYNYCPYCGSKYKLSIEEREKLKILNQELLEESRKNGRIILYPRGLIHPADIFNNDWIFEYIDGVEPIDCERHKTPDGEDIRIILSYNNLYGKRFLDEFVRNIRPCRDE